MVINPHASRPAKMPSLNTPLMRVEWSPHWMRALLASGEPAGRRLEFLTQEFGREANTLGAKSASLGLTGISLDLKAAIERLREQAANVE